MKRINFKDIDLSWFISTGEKVKHTFTDVPTFIRGENRTVGQIDQKNGCGKTVIFLDSILFAIYGEVSRHKFTKSDIPFNKGGKKKCFVCLRFDIVVGDITKEVKIIRTLQPSKLVLEVDGVDMSQSNSSATTAYIVSELLGGISIDVFKQSIAMDLKATSSFLTMKKPERDKFLGGVFDLTYIKLGETIAREKYNTASKALDTLKGKHSVMIPRIQTIESNIESTKKELEEEHQANVDKLSSFKTYFDSFTEPVKPVEISLVEESAKIDTAFEQLQELQNKYQDELAKITSDGNKLKNEKSTLENNIKSLTRQNESDEKAKTCPTCKREMDDECISELQKVIAQRVIEIKESLELVDVKDNSIKKTREQYRECDNRIKKSNTVRDTLNTKKRELSVVVEENQKEIRGYNESMNKIEVARDKFEKLQGIVDAGINSNSLDRLEKELKETNDSIEVMEYELKDLEEDLEVLSHIKILYSDKGIRNIILGRIVDLFNTNANLYLKRLELPCTIEFDEGFEYIIKTSGGIEMPLGGLSGGERLRLSTALALTFKDILRIQNQTSFNIAIYDEWFDASIDARGLSCISDILTERHKNFNETPNIITHRTELQLEDSQDVLVVKEGGMSRIES